MDPRVPKPIDIVNTYLDYKIWGHDLMCKYCQLWSRRYYLIQVGPEKYGICAIN